MLSWSGLRTLESCLMEAKETEDLILEILSLHHGGNLVLSR